MRRQIDSYSMLICSKYVKDISDIINITLVNSKFRDNIDKFHFNPFRINKNSRKYFSNLQTQWLFDKDDVIYSDGDISGYYVYYQINYSKYLEMKDKYQNIKFRRIIYTKIYGNKYGDEIPNIVNKLDESCFSESEIKEIKIPDSIVEIGNVCFYGCESLTSITISSRLTKIGEGVFSQCYQIKSITLPSVLTSLNKNMFYKCNVLKTIEYSPFVVNLNDKLFYNAGGLSRITIPSSITRIGNGCFSDCCLTSLTIPSNVIEFGNNAFSDNYALKEVELPNNMMKLSDYMFYNCKNLTKINIPSSLIKIGKGCFNECKKLTIPTTIISQFYNVNSNYFIDREGISEIVFNNEITFIGGFAFSLNPIKTVIIPSSLSCLNNSFRYCSELTHIELPDSVGCIGTNTFSKFSSLEFIVMPKYMKQLPKSCFSNCSRLTRIELPSSVTKIGNCCFKGCIKLKEINIPKKLKMIGEKAFLDCIELQTITGNIKVCIKYKKSFENTPFFKNYKKEINCVVV